MRTRLRSVGWTVLLGFGLAACSQGAPLRGAGSGTQAGAQGQGQGVQGEVVLSFSQFPDLPIPDDAEMDVERTLVFGGGESWFGQLAISAPHSASDMFDFYKRNLTRYGWQEVTSVRAPTSVLTHMRDERVLAIQISEATLRGSDILLTVSPRERATQIQQGPRP